ncbi:MAG: hypothetical protein HXX11_15200 [Desulfuromonadales bacterium]|nr:hypothetical protein [Desulfuromonadales bacterium]
MSDTEHYPMQAKSDSENSLIVCGAKTRTGTACKNQPMAGKKRCRMHGGASPSGKDHWNFKHGYWSKEEKQQRTKLMRMMKAYLNEMQMT